MTGRAGLYVHLPFCEVKCRFCDFAAYPGRMADRSRYVDALLCELETCPRVELDTVFFGGGTPTTLSEADWRRLAAGIGGRFTLSPDVEMSCECNPESAGPPKLEALREVGVNRLSFGLQAAQDRLLRGLGRLHDYAAFLRAYRAARDLGFDNVNVDLMYGLPGQTMQDWRETLDRVVGLGPEHVSAYALSVEEKTSFHHKGVEADGDLQADMYEFAADRLAGAGYGHYEISNFAKPGFECRHNLKYWRNQDCLGVGVSSASYVRGLRRKNTPDLTGYLGAIQSGRSPVAEERRLSAPEQAGENLILGLRLQEGVSLEDSARALYGAVLENFRGKGFLTADLGGIHWTATRKGWLLSNLLFQELLAPYNTVE